MHQGHADIADTEQFAFCSLLATSLLFDLLMRRVFSWLSPIAAQVGPPSRIPGQRGTLIRASSNNAAPLSSPWQRVRGAYESVPGYQKSPLLPIPSASGIQHPILPRPSQAGFDSNRQAAPDRQASNGVVFSPLLIRSENLGSGAEKPMPKDQEKRLAPLFRSGNQRGFSSLPPCHLPTKARRQPALHAASLHPAGVSSKVRRVSSVLSASASRSTISVMDGLPAVFSR